MAGEVDAAAAITVYVKFSGWTLPVVVSMDSTVMELKSLLQPLTNVLPRGQKLIYKGKVLGDTSSLKSSQIINGSKVMLVASQGLHQGDGPITSGIMSTLSISERVTYASSSQVSDSRSSTLENRSRNWRITGVASLTESNLKVVPKELWNCGTTIRALDLTNNLIREVPVHISSMQSLKKLFLNSNDIEDDCVCWEGLSALKSLKILSLNYNRLSTLPPALGSLTSLSELHITNNKLIGLPDEIGLLTQLQVLKASSNRISSVPATIGNCSALAEVDLSCNLLLELPETLGDLRILKSLLLRHNGLNALPSTLFKGCSQLSLLDLHGTQITNDVLRQIEGWADFDQRRRSKVQKLLDFHVGFLGEFDEGADDAWRS